MRNLTPLAFFLMCAFLATQATASEPPKKYCAAYAAAYLTQSQGGNWEQGMRWEDVEAVGNSFTTYNSKFDAEYIQQYAGRIGTLIRRDAQGYKIACSATLISKDVLLTAAHCATFPGANGDGDNVGVLFSYQKAGTSETPRIAVNKTTRYVTLDELYAQGQYFSITFLESGWDTPNEADKVDYALYQVNKGPVGRFWIPPQYRSYASDRDELWPWVSPSNTLNTGTIWTLLGGDNTNGHRGWTWATARRLNANESVVAFGHPGALPKIASAGVFKRYDYGKAFAYYEDRMVITGADAWPGSSGSGVIDANGNLAGVLVWTSCYQAGAPWGTQITNLAAEVETYVTPMWAICEASEIVQGILGDSNCNGTRDIFELYQH